MEIETDDDSFETFFNNEALSDRLLVITEVTKVYPVVATPSGETRSGNKRPHDCCVNIDYPDCSSNKRVNIQCADVSNSNGNAGSSVEMENAVARVEMSSGDDEASQLNVEIEQLHMIEEHQPADEAAILDDEQCLVEQEMQPTDGRNCTAETTANTENIKSDGDIPIDNPGMESEPVNNGGESKISEDTDVNIITPKVEFEKDSPSACCMETLPLSSSLSAVPSTSTSTSTLPVNHTSEIPLPSTNSAESADSSQSMLGAETKVLKETRVFVHSVILAAKSQYFKCLFATSGMRETKEKEVKIEIPPNQTKSMIILLHCFYYKNFINSQNLHTVLDVCALAMQYCYDGLIEKCLDIFRCRAENVTEVHDINQIAHMVSKIQNDLQQHKEKCTRVMKTCGPFLMNSFYPIDELLEKSPEKFYQLHLNSMHLLLDRSVQERFNQDYGNLFVYAMQKWLRAHLVNIMRSEQFKSEVIKFIEKLLNVVDLRYITGAFLTNVMSFEHSPLALWDGYKDWYIRALQTFIYEYTTNKRNDSREDQQFAVLKRRRLSKFVRKEKNADIFSLTSPIILNGFEIGVYLRIREDRKIHLICKCKNLVINKRGFDQCQLHFRIRGTIKINVDQNIWFEHFPQPHSHWVNDWFGFSYKQGGMCLQMYSVCRLPESVYELASKFGFSLAMQIQQLK